MIFVEKNASKWALSILSSVFILPKMTKHDKCCFLLLQLVPCQVAYVLFSFSFEFQLLKKFLFFAFFNVCSALLVGWSGPLHFLLLLKALIIIGHFLQTLMAMPNLTAFFKLLTILNETFAAIFSEIYSKKYILSTLKIFFLRNEMKEWPRLQEI